MKRKIDLLEFGLDPDQCCYCAKEKVETSRYGLPWCEDHKPRGRLLNWGASHRFPALQCKPFAIGAGGFCWYVAVVAGTNDLIRAAFAALAHLETVSVPTGTNASQRGSFQSEVEATANTAAVQQNDCTRSAIHEQSAQDQEIARLRKEVRTLAGRMKSFFDQSGHRDTRWESSGRMHMNGTLTEKDYLARVVNTLRIGDTDLLSDVIEAMQRTLGQYNERQEQ